MVEETGYRLWLKLRAGKRLSTGESRLTITAAGRTVTIESDRPPEPLSDASWLVLGCRGFGTREQARAFGEELRRAAHLAGLCARVGVDAGNPGEDRTKSRVDPDILDFAPDGNADRRLGRDVHGIEIQPDDDNTIFMRGRASGEQRASATSFVEALEQSLSGGDGARESVSLRRAVRVLNLAEMNVDPIAKVVLAVSAIESLAVESPWTVEQERLISETVEWVKSARGEAEGAERVVGAVEGLQRGGIGARVRRLLRTNGFGDLARPWDKLYGRRSRLFHGDTARDGEHSGEHLDESALHRLGEDAVKLCARIVLSLAKREGLPVPDRAGVHFGVE